MFTVPKINKFYQTWGVFQIVFEKLFNTFVEIS